MPKTTRAASNYRRWPPKITLAMSVHWLTRFRYNDCDLAATLDELAAAAAGFCDEVARTGERDWDRVGTRLPGELRTARWLVRQATHEGVHHLGDIRRFGETLRGRA
jgi:hypothetical protein